MLVLLHPLLSYLLEGLLLLFGLPSHVGPWSVQELHVGVHQLLHHLLGVLLLLLNLLREILHLAKPFARAFWCLHSPVLTILSHRSLLHWLDFAVGLYPVWGCHTPLVGRATGFVY